MNRKLIFTSWAILSFSALHMHTTDGNSSVIDSEICGFFNEIEIPDPLGDATPGSPSYVDILGLNIRQLGQYVQFEWLTAGNPYNEEEFGYYLVLDTDLNPATGNPWGGAELKIVVEIHDSGAIGKLVYFGLGDDVIREEGFLATYDDSGFIFNLDKSQIPGDRFNLEFKASGEPPWSDWGSAVQIQLQPEANPISVNIVSAQAFIESKPHLINIPSQSVPIQLTTSLNVGDTVLDLENSQVSYRLSHPAHGIDDPESVISIDAQGAARYITEGYVTAEAIFDECNLESDTVILATGDAFGDPLTDDVIAVFPSDYVPDGSSFSFGDMMSSYTDYLRTLNLAFNMTSELYAGFIPLDGDKQILAPLVIEGHCGGAGNPLAIAPCCYMVCGNGQPLYGVAIHEMGHNFQQAPGMKQLFFANEGRFLETGIGECSASFPFIYMMNEIDQHGAQYGFATDSFEQLYFSENAEADNSNWTTFDEFEVLLDTGQITGIFDSSGLFDPIDIFCSFFQVYIYGYDGHATPNRHEMIRRFLNIFGKNELPEFEEDKVETYFAAAFSVSVGSDERDQLRHWGFTIEDEYYEQVEPILGSLGENLIFKDGFESH